MSKSLDARGKKTLVKFPLIALNLTVQNKWSVNQIIKSIFGKL